MVLSDGAPGAVLGAHGGVVLGQRDRARQVCARAAPGSRLPAAKWFKATALSSGDGHSVPMVAVKRVCTVCGKGPLPAIGWARANGADHRDWSFRQTHKKCWKPK